MAFPHDLETWIMWLTFAPLLGASVVGFALTLDMLVQLRRRNLLADEVREDFWRYVDGGELGKALNVALTRPSRAARIADALLTHASRRTDLLKERAIQTGAQIARELDGRLGGLALIATLGPLFGLFGTVVGIVLVFNRLAATEGVATPQQLAGGISTALYTTIAGLVIGILALVFHRYFSARVDRRVSELEGFGLDLVDRLTGGAS